MRRLLFSLMLLLFAAANGFGPAHAAGQTPRLLFENYAYHAPKAEIAALPGATESEENFAGDILLPETSFAGHKWVPRLEFRDERLVRVSLMAAYSAGRMEAVTSFLSDEGYEILALLADDRSLDFISFLKIDGPKALQEKIGEMLSGGPHKRVTYAWFATGGLSRDTKIMARNLTDFFMLAPSVTREAEVTLLRADGGEQVMILVDFTYPILDAM
ncbi:MAG: hypothetical protein LBR94_03940 [Desulfovibrio sp.]|jgi:hypothetical protein|nr:hypothetical protein [Desulfovibrio sp.]